MKSATELILDKTFEEVWRRGEGYADAGKVTVLRCGEKEIEAAVKGTGGYTVLLKFSGGGISRACTCPYAGRASAYRPVCKHMVAVAVVWDEMRGIKRPGEGAVSSCTIAPPLVTRSRIDAVFKDPVHGDLEVLRLAAESRGSWSRPHARLPNMPKFNPGEGAPLTLAEAQKAFREIKRWADRSAYDMYFCAGEMVAAFCEVLRLIRKRTNASQPLVVATALREAQQFHYQLVQELIDDSDGHWRITEAHLDDIYNYLLGMRVPEDQKEAFEKRLREYDSHRSDY